MVFTKKLQDLKNIKEDTLGDRDKPYLTFHEVDGVLLENCKKCGMQEAFIR